ncbi:MAG TPA: hypothetical protein VMH86_13070 [Rhizomicrobium sp.]|nr:hypothetical protein [Rhizomicrobium sp.]
MIWLQEAWLKAGAVPAAKRFVQENGSGLVGSALLHGLILFLILFFMTRTGTLPQQTVVHFVPVEVVRLGAETVAPPASQKTAVPQQRAARIPVPESSSPKPPVGTAPRKTAPPVDDLQAKLRGLAKLRQPDAPLRALDNDQTADADTTSEGAVPGDEATYSLRDYIRAQIERRWSLSLATLGNRKMTILLRVEITRNGTVTKSEIVDQARFRTDFAFHEIALSARNAVLLSSPFALPPGDYKDTMDMTLRLNPRDALH